MLLQGFFYDKIYYQMEKEDFVNIKILYEDKNLIAVEKKHNIPTQKDKSRNTDLLTSVEFFLKINDRLKSNESLFLLNRLDRPVGGIVLMAKNQNSARVYSNLIKEQKITKEYLAVCSGISKELNKTLVDYIETDSKNNISIITSNESGKYSKLTYETLDANDSFSLLKINLITGRHHQIRVQLAHNQLPIWGDTKYNDDFTTVTNVDIALWAFHISFKNPFSSKLIDIYSYPDKNKKPWNKFDSLRRD
jgi:23S rRNA pseudouridine1911/1915/1917 synthase